MLYYIGLNNMLQKNFEYEKYSQYIVKIFLNKFHLKSSLYF